VAALWQCHLLRKTSSGELTCPLSFFLFSPLLFSVFCVLCFLCSLLFVFSALFPFSAFVCSLLCNVWLKGPVTLQPSVHDCSRQAAASGEGHGTAHYCSLLLINLQQHGQTSLSRICSAVTTKFAKF